MIDGTLKTQLLALAGGSNSVQEATRLAAADKLLRLCAERAREFGQPFNGIATEYAAELLLFYAREGGNKAALCHATVRAAKRKDKDLCPLLAAIQAILYKAHCI